MTFRRWFDNLMPMKSAKYGTASDWAAAHFPADQRDIAARIAEILVNQLNVRFDELDGTTQFIKDLRMDDHEPGEVVAAVESAFEVSLPAKDTASMETVADLVRYVAGSQLHATCLACMRQVRVPVSERGRIVDCPNCYGLVDVPEHDPLPDKVASIENTLPIPVDELILRRVKYGDKSDLFEIYSHPDVVRYQLFEAWTLEQAEWLVCSQYEIKAGDPGVPFFLVAVYVPDDKVIGDCQLTISSAPDRQGEIGFALNPNYGGRGLATKMVGTALGFAFNHLDLHRIIASVDVRNEPSWRLMERVGMRREAHFIHRNFVNGEWIDDYVYAILDEEWRARNS
ncbi:MAG: ydaF [Schlesneria sp.]|nr:ydaF [Schlesneria sp.]